MEALARDPDASLYSRKVAEEAGVSTGAASMILRTLEASKLVDVEEKGTMKFYRINLQSPLAREFKILFSVKRVNGLVERLKSRAERVILFGSSAEGTDSKDSDVDLFILTQDPQTVRSIIRRSGKELDRDLSPIIVNAEGFARLRREDKPLFERIMGGKRLWERE